MYERDTLFLRCVGKFSVLASSTVDRAKRSFFD